MARIKMPVTPRSAYDPARAPNALLLAHVRELESALSKAGRRVRKKKPRTEEQVAAYIRHLSRALHHQLLLPPMQRRPLDVPLDALSPPARPKARRASGARTARPAAAASRRKKKASSLKRKRSRRA
jgi:hypothetical protein